MVVRIINYFWEKYYLVSNMMNIKIQKMLKKCYSIEEGFPKLNSNLSSDLFKKNIDDGVFYPAYTSSHSALVSALKTTYASVKKKRVTNAFIYSISHRALYLRSILFSYGISRVFPVHKFEANKTKKNECRICGEPHNIINFDINLLSYERYNYGGINFINTLYVWFDLREFCFIKENFNITTEDILLFKNIILSIEKLKAPIKFNDIVRNISKLFECSRMECQRLISNLAMIGILNDNTGVNFFYGYESRVELKSKQYFKPSYENFSSKTMISDYSERKYEINYEALKYYFGSYAEFKDIF